MVTDQAWQRLESILPGKASNARTTAKDYDLFLQSVFCRGRTGSPQRDLPPVFGNRDSQFRQFRRWANVDIFESLFKAMSDDPDLEFALMDGTIVQGYRKATGAKGRLRLRPSGVRVAG